MNNKVKSLSTLVIILAAIALVVGIIFIQQGYAKEAFLTNAMKQEQITITGVDGIVENAQKAQLAGDTVREHRHSIAPTYGDLLGGKQYDPTDPTQLTYAQALNLENYLYLAVASFGVFLVVKAMGAFMILMGLALGIVGFALRSIARG
jgi:ABC-type antimicrobial peptide transport system permease subunit